MRSCQNCILPQSYPNITFDEDGVCNYCRHLQSKEIKGENALNKIFESIKRGKGSEYDGVVGISGGRDSAYLLHYLIKVQGLKVLAYSADHGFVPEAAKQNMHKMVTKLQVDFILEKHDYLIKSLRSNLAAWIKKPSPAMIPMLCCGCRLGMFAGLFNAARRNNITHIFVGRGSSEDSAFKQEFFKTNWLARIADVRHSKQLSILLGLLYESARNPYYFFNPRSAYIYFKEYFYFFLFELGKIRKLFYPRQTIVNFFEYMDWDESRILETITRELDWRKPKQSQSYWRFDCEVSYLKNFMLLNSVGFSEKDDLLSTLIREAKITRAEAQARVVQENRIPAELITSLCRRSGVDPVALTAAIKRIEYRSN